MSLVFLMKVDAAYLIWGEES